MIPKTGWAVWFRLPYNALPFSVRSLSRIATSLSSAGSLTARALALPGRKSRVPRWPAPSCWRAFRGERFASLSSPSGQPPAGYLVPRAPTHAGREAEASEYYGLRKPSVRPCAEVAKLSVRCKVRQAPSRIICSRPLFSFTRTMGFIVALSKRRSIPNDDPSCVWRVWHLFFRVHKGTYRLPIPSYWTLMRINPRME